MANPAGMIPRSSRLSDYLNNFRFHVIDVSFQTPVVLNMAMGFRSCTAPQITVETKEIKEGTYEYKKSFAVGASVDDIELHQGVQMFSSDFYEWIVAGIAGKTSTRRNLILIQFSDKSALGVGANGQGSKGGSGFGEGNIGNLVNAVLPMNELLSRIPGKMWLLRDVIPVRYKAGSDFDAMGAEISIAELAIRPYSIDEFSVGL